MALNWVYNICMYQYAVCMCISPLDIFSLTFCMYSHRHSLSTPTLPQGASSRYTYSLTLSACARVTVVSVSVCLSVTSSLEPAAIGTLQLQCQHHLDATLQCLNDVDFLIKALEEGKFYIAAIATRPPAILKQLPRPYFTPIIAPPEQGARQSIQAVIKNSS